MFTKQEIENIILKGEEKNFHGGQKKEGIVALWGEPLDERRGGKQLVLQYKQASFVLISEGLKLSMKNQGKNRSKAENV